METYTQEQLRAEINRLKDSLAGKDREIEKMRMGGFFLETLFDGIEEQIMVIDPAYYIKDVNRAFLDQYGMKKEDVLGKKCHVVTYGSDSPCAFGRQMCPLERAKETGQKIELTHNYKTEEGESKELVRIVYPLIATGKPPEYFVEISRDVTEYRNLILKLKASEKKFRTILDTATDAILSIDENHRIVLFNNAAQQIFEYSRSEVLGKNLNLLIPQQYGDHFMFVKRFLEEKTPKIMGKTLPLKALRKGGEEFPIELGLSYYEMKGDITFTAIIRDVTAQKQLEKSLLQSERLAAVGQTVAHVAHEIKNPLMIIGGFSHQIKKSLVGEKSIQKIDMVLDEVSRLEKLVANLGDFTKEYTLMKRSADINSVIGDVMKLMGEIYPSEKFFFKVDLSPDVKEINCDPDKLKQVFINIIANGIEAMEDGGTITIHTGECSMGVEARISDEGIGICEEDLDHIFEPFYTTRKKGSGLGLSISYKIVAAHKGEISAESVLGQGTTFAIRLPTT
jgi:PAS domain S-box-containing protein